MQSLKKLGDSVGILITKSNADDGGRLLNQELNLFVSENENAKLFDSLGQFLYYNCLKVVDCVVGNSSSGLFEVPSFKKPTVNLGDRQKGRTRSDSIIDTKIDEEEIFLNIQKAFKMNCSKVENPYGKGNSSEKILEILENINYHQLSLQKHFFEYKLN